MPNYDLPDAKIVRREKDLSEAEEFVMGHYKNGYIKAQLTPETHEQEEEVKKIDAKPNHGPQTERSIVFDRIVHHFKTWWGDSVEVYRASRFDDRTNATDLIVEFFDEAGASIAVLSLDTSVSNDNLETILTKSQKIIEKLKAKTMGELQHMPTDSVGDEAFETKSLIPQAVVALNPDTLERLCKDIRQSVGEKDGELKIKQHPYQLIVLDSVVEQLVTQREVLDIYEKKGSINIEQKRKMDAKLVEMIDIIKNLISRKKNPPDGGPGVRFDASWGDYVSAFFKNHSDFLRLAA